MLDFTKKKQQFFNLILSDGLRLDIPMPSADEYDELIDKMIGPNGVRKAKEIQKLVLKILNTNQQGIVIEQEEIADLTVADLYAILNGYSKQIIEGLNDPNLFSPDVGKKKTI